MHELTAAYALDALEPEQARAYEDHLGRCGRCREELAELAELTNPLAHAAPAAQPSPDLRRRILVAARADRRRFQPRRPRWALPTLAIAVAASCAAITLGVWTAVRPGPAQLSVLPLRGAAGALVISGDRSAVLVVSGLSRAPAGKTYEVWVLRAGSPPQPAGLFGGGAGTVRVSLNRHVRDGSFVGVTVERAGGAERPTEPPRFISATA